MTLGRSHQAGCSFVMIRVMSLACSIFVNSASKAMRDRSVARVTPTRMQPSVSWSVLPGWMRTPSSWSR